MKHTLKNLRKKHHLAIELRYAGKPYNEIANTIQTETGEACSASGVRNWFADGGKLQQAYFEYCEQENTTRERETRMRLRSLTQDAVERLKKALQDDSDKEGIRASIYVLDRILGKTEENIHLNINEYEHLSDEQLNAELAKLVPGRSDSGESGITEATETVPAPGSKAATESQVPELGTQQLGHE